MPPDAWLDEPTRISLLARIKRSENDGWEEFAALYRPRILHWCRQQGLPCEADAEDVTQVVLLKLFRVLQTFEYDPQKGFRRYLRTIIRNEVADLFRQRQRDPAARVADTYSRLLEFPDRVDALADELSSGATKGNSSLYLVLDLVRRQATEAHWQAFWMTTVEGRSAREVGQELGLSEGAVNMARSRLKSRALKLLNALQQEQTS